MDKITREDISLQTERELTSPLSPKRPRTDCTVTNNHSGKSRFDFPELLTFRKSVDSTSSRTLQENVGLICIAYCEDIEDKPHKQPHDTELIVTTITGLTTSHTDNAHTGSSECCLIAAERRFKLLGREGQPPVTETDKLCSYLADDAGGALAESHTSKDTSADMSSHPDCKWLGKSLEYEPPGGCSLHAGNDEDGRQVQNSVSQIQAFTLSSSDEGVRCQSDCTYEDALHDAGFCDTLSQSAEVEESNQKRDEHGFSENILFNKETEGGNSPISSTDYADSKSLCSNPEEQPSGNLAEGVKNEEKILQLQICENENVAVCDGETKGQVNENGMSKNFIPSAAECAEGSLVSYDVVLARNTATESVSLETDDFCGAKGEHAAGKMIAKAPSETADHTTETPMPARISQGPAEGDNDASPFSVIDPAIWCETDREAEEKRCNSESTAGVESLPSVKVCEMKTPLPLCSDVRLSQEVSTPEQSRQFNHQSRTQQCEDEKEDLWQSYTESQVSSITTNETNNGTGNKGSCHWKSSPSSSPHRPAKPPPAGHGRHDTVGHQLKDLNQSGCFPVSLNHLKTHEVEFLHTEMSRMDRATEVKKREEMTSFEEETKTDEHRGSENSPDVEEKLLQQNEKHIEDLSTGDGISVWTDGKIHKYANKLTHIDEELGNNLACLSDHPYSAVMSTMKGTTEEKGRKEEASVGDKTDVHGNSEILVKSEEDHQQQSQQKGDMTECISEFPEGNMSKSGHKCTVVSQHEEENKLSCISDYQHRAETFMDENKDDLLAFTFPPPSDAVVPGPHELLHSQNADNNPTALNCNDRFSPAPSAFTFSNRVPGGFDTFEKIQLSHDDEIDLRNSPLLTSLPGQLLKTPQLYHSMPEAESNKHEELPEEEEEEEEEEGEEEVERFECHTEYMETGSDTSCNELPNFISAADVIALGWPGQQPNCESAYKSSECFQDNLNPQSMSCTVLSKSNSATSDVNHSPEFEMKKQFDMVLKELNLYFEISIMDFASDSRASSPEQCSDMTEALEGDTSNYEEEHLSSPQLGRHRGTSSGDAHEDRSLEMCEGDPVVSCTSSSGDSEQEVPLGSHLCQETTYTAEKHKEPRETEQKRKMWSPSFACRPLLEQLSHRQPEQPRRLEPLRTCTRPIRVGLSKRAKTKHLHRPHPYK